MPTIDTTIALFIHRFASLPLDSFFSIVTLLGSTAFLTVVVVLAVIYLALKLEFHKAHIVALSAILSSIASISIKHSVKRIRPDLWPHKEMETFSFPSGHSLCSIVIYGIMAYLLAEAYPLKRKWIYLSCGCLIFLIGLSRTYLGVHWPTDVVGGWLIGAALLSLMIWWYHKGGIAKTVRWGIGLVAIIIGLIGMVVPILPGIPFLIAGFLLIFTNKSFADFFKKKKKPELT